MSTLPALREDQHGVIPVEESPSMLAIVMREASNPNVDPARLREFLAIGRELEADRARLLYNQAWAEMAPELPYIAENGRNTFTGNRYAKWDDIHRACMPVLRKHGFSVSFDSRKDGDVLFVIVVIKHIGGHEERPEFAFPWRDPSKGRGPADEVSAALSKAQRHAFRKAFNILSIGEEEKFYSQTLTEKQVQDLDVALAEFGPGRPKIEERLLTVYQVKALKEIPANCYSGAVSLLQAAQRGPK